MCGIELIHRIQTTFFIVGSSGTFCFECILNKASYMLEHNLSQMALNRLTVSQLEKDLER